MNTQERANIIKDFLPDVLRSTIEPTESQWKEQIFKHLGPALEGNDFDNARNWLDFVSSYANSEVFTMTIDEVERILKVLYKFITSSYWLELVISAVGVFGDINKPYVNHTRIFFDWRPIYNRIYKFSLSNSKVSVQLMSENYLKAMSQFVDSCRIFFTPQSVQEMLDEWSHMLNSKTVFISIGYTLLTKFLPVENEIDPTPFFDDMIKQYSLYNSKIIDQIFLRVFVRLSTRTQEKIDWIPHIPLFFSKLSHTLAFPFIADEENDPSRKQIDFIPRAVSYFLDIDEQDDKCLSFYAQLFIDLLASPAIETVKEHLSRTLDIISVALLPSKELPEKRVSSVEDFLDSLVYQYSSNHKNVRDHKMLLPPLSKETDEWFVSKLVPIYTTFMYSLSGKWDLIDRLIQLAPKIAIPPIVDVITNLISFEHFKSSGYTALQNILPVAYVTGICIDQIKEILLHMVDDIAIADQVITTVIFVCYETFFCIFPYDDLYKDVCISLVHKAINFACISIGDDYEEPNSYLNLMFHGLNHFVQDHDTYDEIATVIENRLEEVPTDNIKHILNAYTPEKFSKWCFAEVTERNLVIVQSLVRSNKIFYMNHRHTIQEFVLKAIHMKDKKIKKRVPSLIKWTLKMSCLSLPHVPKWSGIRKISKDSVQFRIVQKDDEIKFAVEFFDVLFKEIKELYATEDVEQQAFALKILNRVMSGMIGAANPYDFDIVEESKLPVIPLNILTHKEISAKIEQCALWLNEIVKPEMNQKVLYRIISCYFFVIFPLHDYAIKDQMYMVSDNHTFSKLNILFPYEESMFYLNQYFFVVRLIARWIRTSPFPITKLGLQALHTVLSHANSPYDNIILSIKTIVDGIKKFVKIDTCQFLEPLIPLLENCSDLESGSILNLTMCINELAVNMAMEDHFDVIGRISLAIAQPGPADMPVECFIFMRNNILDMLKSTECFNVAVNPKIKDMRRTLIYEAIKKSNDYLANGDIQNYLYDLVTSYAISLELEPIIEPPILSFLLNKLLETDSTEIREQMIYSIIYITEIMIPRTQINQKIEPKYKQREPIEDINESEDVSTSELLAWTSQNFHEIEIIREKPTPQNYDNITFYKKKISQKTNKISVLMSKEEAFDINFLSKYFKDPQNRIELHKILYETFYDDDKYTRKLLDKFINAQVCNKETLEFHRSNLWRALCRFFGPGYCIKLLDLIDSMDDENMATRYSVSEVLDGIISATVNYNYSQIEMIQPRLFKYIKARFQDSPNDSFYPFFMGKEIKLIMKNEDTRKLFWFYDFLLSLEQPKGKNYSKRSMLISNYLVEAAQDDIDLFKRVMKKYLEPLFQTKLLEVDFYQRATIDIVTLIFSACLSNDWIELKEQLFYEYILPASDTFICKWLLTQFGIQYISSLSCIPLCIDCINEWHKMIEKKDEDEEQDVIQAVAYLLSSNLLAGTTKLPLTKESTRFSINRILEQFDINQKLNWPTITLLLQNLQRFLRTVYFFIDESVVEGLIESVVKPCLLHKHTDVQFSATSLLSFIFTNFPGIKAKKPEYLDEFIEMMNSNKKATRIAGVKSIFAIISSTHLFDSVPDYLIKAFNAISDFRGDSSIKSSIHEFISGFWSCYKDNVAEEVALKLSEFTDTRPSYIS